MKHLFIIFLSCHSLLVMAQTPIETTVERYDSIVSIISSDFDWSKLDLPNMKKEEGRKEFLKFKAPNMEKLLTLIKIDKRKGDVGALWRIMELENDSIKDLSTKYNEAVAKYDNAEKERTKLQKELEVRLYLERTDSKIFEDDFKVLQTSDIPDVWKSKYELIPLIQEFKKTLDLILSDKKNGKVKEKDKESIYSLYDKIEAIGLNFLSKEQLQYYDAMKKAFNDVI